MSTLDWLMLAFFFVGVFVGIVLVQLYYTAILYWEERQRVKAYLELMERRKHENQSKRP